MKKNLLLTAVLLFGFGVATSQAQEPEEPGNLTDAQFRRLTMVFLEDPTGKKSKELAKVIIIYTMKTPKAIVVLGTEEMKWTGGKEKPNILLFAGYLAGNTRAQLDSGVKRDETYAGLLTLFRVYRAIKEKQKGFQNASIEKLLKLHKDQKLMSYVIEYTKKREKEMKENKKKLDI